MAYISAHFDSEKNKVFVLENDNGEPTTKIYKPEYFFYVEDENGSHLSTFRTKVKRLEFNTNKDFRTAVKKHQNFGKRLFESGVKPLFKTLEKHYKGVTKKFKLRKTYFDIEVDWHPVKGFAPPEDPFNKITAISLFNDWEGVVYSLVLPPPTMKYSDAEELLKDIPNNIICQDEEQLFELFFELTKDTQIYTGWNSSFFDIPYIVNRSKQVMGKDSVKNFCLWGYTPVSRTMKKYGKESETFDLIGKVHLDMMELYQKYTFSEKASYSLDYIANEELGKKKVAYNGSLDDLYKNDFRKFVEYSRQDTQLLFDLDSKLDHINMAYAIAHGSLVDIKTVMGAVALSDNAIVLEAHSLNMVVPDKVRSNGDVKIAGAMVVNPQKGLHGYTGSVDLNSLYPSVFRALNLGNETIIGQVLHTITGPIIQERMSNIKESELDDSEFTDKKEATFAEAWRDFFWVKEFDEIHNQTDTMLQLQLNDGTVMEMSAKDIHDFVFQNDYIITANATIIRTDFKSVISTLLERWYNERTQFQKRAKTYASLVDGIELSDDMIKLLTSQ